MSNSGNAATMILALALPILAGAQVGKTAAPAPQQRPAATAPATAMPAPAAGPQQPAPSPNSRRFVTSDNFYRPQPKSNQPAPPVNADGKPVTQPVTQPRTPAVASKPIPMPAAPRAIIPSQPAVAAVPDMRAPQSNLIQPLLITGSSHITGPEATAAVDYAGGQLSVVSDGAPLGFVLKLIAAKTGAVVDIAPELQNDPVAAHAGPGPVREVLTGLLDSPRLDYIVLGTGDEPGSLQRIVVRKRQSFGQVALAAVHQPQARQNAPEEEQLDQNGHLVSNGPTPAEAQASQQRMEEWKKTRAQMLAAEMKQQAQDRENERFNNPNTAINNPNNPDPPAPPQDSPQPPPADNPPQQENPPQS